ncbi:MAG: 1-deoxy-D-xylulose-5-phosphate reductoisomerase [Candidatus Omnitrophota bacterium]
MRRIAILGSTGSIGKNAAEVIRNLPQEFKVVALSTNSDIEALYLQIKEFRPQFACVRDKTAASVLESRLHSRNIRILRGDDGLEEMIKQAALDKVLLAISGAAALMPLIASVKKGIDIALANKEALVMAGPFIINEAKRNNVLLIPVDSEQSAIWQCLRGEDKKRIKKVYLTASGGPLRTMPKKDFSRITVKEVLKHPRWKMGDKITVDSASLMNKGLEVLETMILFGISADKIKVLIHPESVIHSMVEFIDGTILAQLSRTDMRIPIQYALTYPVRLGANGGSVDFFKLKALHFEEPDFNKFPCLELAYRAAHDMGSAPCVLNAADEIAVEGFLQKRIQFSAIPKVIGKVLKKHRLVRSPSLKEILQADAWAREEARSLIEGMN